MKSVRLRRVLSALMVSAAALGAVAVATGTAQAADSYLCGTSVSSGSVTATGCVHLGGNGYWQPYIQISGSNRDLITGTQWINSNGTDGDFSNYEWDLKGSYRIWGTSTNWRVSCYVQAQADVNIDGTYAGRVYSPSEYVC